MEINSGCICVGVMILIALVLVVGATMRSSQFSQEIGDDWEGMDE